MPNDLLLDADRLFALQSDHALMLVEAEFDRFRSEEAGVLRSGTPGPALVLQRSPELLVGVACQTAALPRAIRPEFRGVVVLRFPADSVRELPSALVEPGARLVAIHPSPDGASAGTEELPVDVRVEEGDAQSREVEAFQSGEPIPPIAPRIADFLCVDEGQLEALREGIDADQWEALERVSEGALEDLSHEPRDGRPLHVGVVGPPATQGAGRSPFFPGQVVGGWVLSERLGRGSMGEVWRGTREGADAAIKLPLRPSFVRHLRQEGVLLDKIDHPNVARLIEADVAAEIPYLATELVHGQPLRAICRGTISPPAATLLCDQLLNGLEAIHDAGVLHLDLKPENVIVQDDGRIKIVDLGLGRATTRFMEEVYLSVSLASREPPVAGTLAYMSPEQRRGRELDARADLFAFGILLHELLSGVLPSPGVSLTDRRAGLVPRWDVAIARLTHPDRARRPQDARAARLIVSYTLSDKLVKPVAKGGVEPRRLASFDEESFALASPYVVGQVIGEGYELVRPLGRGGFGEVWEARRGEDERVAIKLVLNDEAVAGLAHEAEASRKIDHPRVANLIADCSSDTPPHLVFEVVEGRSLRLILNECDKPLPIARALEIFEGQLEVVRACAEAGVVHMDLKPEHFLINETAAGAQVSLIDFGLSSFVEREHVEGSLASQAEIKGTLDYMAPEQRRGEVSPAVDVYALGVCLFELLTLNLPRGPQRVRAIRRDVSPPIDALTLRMLDHNPEARPSLEYVQRAIRERRKAWSLGGGARRSKGAAEEAQMTPLRGLLAGAVVLLISAGVGVGVQAWQAAPRRGSAQWVQAAAKRGDAGKQDYRRLLERSKNVTELRERARLASAGGPAGQLLLLAAMSTDMDRVRTEVVQALLQHKETLGDALYLYTESTAKPDPAALAFVQVLSEESAKDLFSLPTRPLTTKGAAPLIAAAMAKQALQPLAIKAANDLLKEPCSARGGLVLLLAEPAFKGARISPDAVRTFLEEPGVDAKLQHACLVALLNLDPSVAQGLKPTLRVLEKDERLTNLARQALLR